MKNFQQTPRQKRIAMTNQKHAMHRFRGNRQSVPIDNAARSQRIFLDAFLKWKRFEADIDYGYF